MERQYDKRQFEFVFMYIIQHLGDVGTTYTEKTRHDKMICTPFTGCYQVKGVHILNDRVAML